MEMKVEEEKRMEVRKGNIDGFEVNKEKLDGEWR